MFANLFFLILNLLLISSAIDQTNPPFLADDPGIAFSLFIVSVFPFLLFLSRQSSWLQKKRRDGKEPILFITNIELLLFFSFFNFFLGAARWPITNFSPFGVTGFSICSLLLYFIGLFLCHRSIERDGREGWINSWLSICFLLPFAIPFLLISIFSETSNYLSFDKIFNFLEISENNFWHIFFVIFINTSLIILTLIFLPPLTVLIWQCPKLKDSALKNELDQLCQRANFKHAGFRIWQIMNTSMTAAIIGILGKFRYVLFTQKLLDHVPNHALMAILAHEIGHSYYFHLFFYPLILLGMMLAGSLVHIFLYFPLLKTLSPLSWIPLFSFLLFIGTLAIYFRFVFGYFSRIFERQADLHVFKLGIPAKDMVEALDILAKSAGNIHREPNWHHYSIQERIDYLNETKQDRSLILKHSRRVWISLFLYFICLIIAVLILWNS